MKMKMMGVMGHAVGFVTNQSYYCPSSHHEYSHTTAEAKQLHLRALHFSASDVDIRETYPPTAETTTAAASLIQILSTEERNHIDELVNKRSEARWEGDYQKADEIRDVIEKTKVLIPRSTILQSIKDVEYVGNCFTQHQDDVECKIIITDTPRSGGGISQWELMPIDNPFVDKNTQQQEDNVLQLAHAALGMAVSASERGVAVDKDIMSELISRAEDRLQTLKQRRATSIFFPGNVAAVGELHGRKAADAALWFALAGVSSKENVYIYNDLVDIATEELQRFGLNSSCRAKDVLHIVERVAMAGIVGESPERLYRVAADCLEAKMSSGDSQERSADENANPDEDEGGINYGNIIQSLRDSTFGLHSDRSLLGLWRFSTRQRKQRAFFQNAARHFDGKFGVDFTASDNLHSNLLDADCSVSNQYDWSAMFDDPSRPLVVDVGCGMGVSLLGLASLDNNIGQPPTQQDEIQIEWSECNFLGVDLSLLAIGYAQGVSERWSLERLSFVVDSADDCLKRICETYPGKVPLVMLQFPTPYRFQRTATDGEVVDAFSVASKGFNSQLPEGSASDDFMVTEQLLSLTHKVLSKHNGQLLIQSNCEDVGE